MTLIGSVANTLRGTKPGDLKIVKEECDVFMKSNRLPTKNIDELKRFEDNLDDPAFRKSSVSMPMQSVQS